MPKETPLEIYEFTNKMRQDINFKSFHEKKLLGHCKYNLKRNFENNIHEYIYRENKIERYMNFCRLSVRLLRKLYTVMSIKGAQCLRKC